MRIPIKILAFAAMGSVLSCSQEEPEFKIEDSLVEPTYTPAEDYLQLKTGNYWVFESYSINLETGEETPLHKRDSIYVLKDTLIGRSEYFILEGAHLGQSYRSVLRCSGPEVMDAEGRLLFSTATIGDTSSIPASLLPEGAESGEAAVHLVNGLKVPYGTFDALEYRRSFSLSSSEEIRTGGNTRHQSDYFAKGIGRVKYTSFFPNQPLDIEMRLVRANIQ